MAPVLHLRGDSIREGIAVQWEDRADSHPIHSRLAGNERMSRAGEGGFWSFALSIHRARTRSGCRPLSRLNFPIAYNVI